MTGSLFPDHLVLVRPDQREPGPVTREQILDEARCDYVFFRFGEGESVVALDGPGPRVVA